MNEYNAAIQKLTKYEDGLTKEILKTQLRRAAKKDLRDLEYHGFEILLNLWTDNDYRDRVLFADMDKNKTHFQF